jgi:hypothetical protein
MKIKKEKIKEIIFIENKIEKIGKIEKNSKLKDEKNYDFLDSSMGDEIMKKSGIISSQIESPKIVNSEVSESNNDRLTLGNIFNQQRLNNLSKKKNDIIEVNNEVDISKSNIPKDIVYNAQNEFKETEKKKNKKIKDVETLSLSLAVDEGNTNVHIYTYVYMNVYEYTFIYAYLFVHIHIYSYIYIYVHTYIYIYIYGNTHIYKYM